MNYKKFRRISNFAADSNQASEKKWVPTLVANLIRYVPSGKFYARVRTGGKLAITSEGVLGVL